MMEANLRKIELARRVLAGVLQQPETVTIEDRRDLLALAEDARERELSLVSLAALLLDRAQRAETAITTR